MVEVPSLGTLVVVALNVPVVAPAATVIDSGTVKVLLVLVSVTLAPPAGAALVCVTVHVLEELGPRLVGLQATAETAIGATSVTVVFAELLL
jgi:hypothetical protein